MTATELVRDAKLVLWDFDGVIKESVDLKTAAFMDLFAPFGADVVDYVRRHHQGHGGMSRYQKIPLYLSYAGEEPTDDRVRELCAQFSERVCRQTIEAPWVPGAEQWIRQNPRQQVFVLVSATPDDELRTIVEALQLTSAFRQVYGTATSKRDAVHDALARCQIARQHSVMIGDAVADWDAARSAGVPFVLRRHSTNAAPFDGYDGPWLEDLSPL